MKWQLDVALKRPAQILDRGPQELAEGNPAGGKERGVKRAEPFRCGLHHLRADFWPGGTHGRRAVVFGPDNLNGTAKSTQFFGQA